MFTFGNGGPIHHAHHFWRFLGWWYSCDSEILFFLHNGPNWPQPLTGFQCPKKTEVNPGLFFKTKGRRVLMREIMPWDSWMLGCGDILFMRYYIILYDVYIYDYNISYIILYIIYVYIDLLMLFHCFLFLSFFPDLTKVFFYCWMILVGSWLSEVSGKGDELGSHETPQSWTPTVDGWNPAPVEVGSLSHQLQGCFTSQLVVWDFFHQQYQLVVWDFFHQQYQWIFSK